MISFPSPVLPNRLVSKNNSANTPEQVLPAELWLKIFVHCLPCSPTLNEDLPEKEVIRDARLIPMVLASVCQTWRRIACGTTELWANCWVNFQHPEINAIWLQRAGTSMLRLYGRPHSQPKDRWGWDGDALVASIIPYQQRWQSLDLDLHQTDTRSDVPELDCPALKAITIDSLLVPAWMLKILQNSSHLQELELVTFDGLDLPVVNTPNPFKSLSTLALSGTSAREIIWVLETLPQLQHLSTNRGDTIGIEGFPLVIHTNLLSLRINESWNPPYILDHLTLPNLRKFHMQYLFECEIVSDFSRRSAFRLTELTVGDPRMSAMSLITALLYPSLGRWVEKFELPWYENYLTTSFFDFLRDDKNLPHLTQLLIHRVNFLSTPEGAVADLVSSLYKPRICRCEECINSPQARVVQLQYVLIDRLDASFHRLDIARLIPLPGDGEVEQWEVATEIELVYVRRDYDILLASYEEDDDLDKSEVKIWLRQSPSSSDCNEV